MFPRPFPRPFRVLGPALAALGLIALRPAAALAAPGEAPQARDGEGGRVVFRHFL